MSNKVKRFADKSIIVNQEIDEIYSVEQEEIDKLDVSLTRIFNNNFIGQADLSTIEKWESILKIRGNTDYSLEERRTLVLNRLLFKPPFTRQRFRDILFNIWGEGNYQFEVIPDEYKVIVDINTINPIIYLQFQTLVRRIVPSNMYLIFSIQYTYLYLKRNMTYKKMSEFTYGELGQYS